MEKTHQTNAQMYTMYWTHVPTLTQEQNSQMVIWKSQYIYIYTHKNGLEIFINKNKLSKKMTNLKVP